MSADPRFGRINEVPPPKEAPAKFWIQSKDEPGISVCAQFNPKELQIDREVPWSPPGEAGKDNSASKGGVDMEFTGAKGRTMTVELLFDAFEKQGDTSLSIDPAQLQARVQSLETMASVRKPGDKQEENRRPHQCIAAWGPALNRFQCVITSISTKYTMFDSDGSPLRASVTLKLAQADSVSVAKAASGGSGSGSGGAPASGGGNAGGQH